DAIIAERTRIQRARKREDSEIVELFGAPLKPVLQDPDYVEVQRKLVEGFGLAEMFEKHRASRVLCVSADPIGDAMRPSSVRALKVAQALSSTTNTAVAAPGQGDYLLDDLPVLRYS